MNILSPTTWLIGAIVLAFIGGTAYVTGRSDGRKVERTEWQAKENKALVDIQTELAKVQSEKDTVERNSRNAMVAASETYQKGLKNEQARKDKVIADLRSGALRLRDPGTRYSLSKDTLPGVGTTTGGCDGAKGGELSDALTEHLITEAGRADEIVRQLTAAQAVINADRVR